jgi:SAM-dependent methyltransferase
VRPLREWMLGMAAADLLDYEDGVFELPAQAIPVLVDSETSPFYAAGSFATMPPDFVQPTIDLLRTGSGAGYGSMSSHELEAMERITGPAFRTTLPNAVIPATGIDARSVATIADVGCGTGVSSSVLAACFPNASVLGVDPSEKAQEVAGERAGESVGFVCRRAEELPELGSFDLVAAFDCLHDMPRPDHALSAIRQALNPGGALIVKEPRSTGDFERDRKNPLLAMSYGFSLTGCLQSGLSTDDGWGLGTLGLHPSALESLAGEFGFESVSHLDVDDAGATWSLLR